ncbi:uncharacterized protein LOC112589922 isoform X2 [Harpegnathos saltator]|uniref:uncharacterized protein LOC112589922 isoform X2 n=1 Tax=Harpegnathos saltator TaxID=610380 RepID=UPI000DBEF221|nr:uncharacterized protein LOC112589922 isoform X2 [Harpegnathos saltator]
MQSKGYTITTTQIENKYKSLERSFKNMIANNKKTGKGCTTCLYQTELTELLGSRHNIEPLAVSGREGLILREDVRASTSLSISDFNDENTTDESTLFYNMQEENNNAREVRTTRDIITRNISNEILQEQTQRKRNRNMSQTAEKCQEKYKQLRITRNP